MQEIHLTKKDFRIRFFSGSGAGGQHRNKCQNCCEIIHIETGIKAQCTEHRERHRNQHQAFRELAKRIIEYYKSQEVRPTINTEVIRTYHEPDNRVKDHLSRFQQPYSVVVDSNNIGDMITARAKAIVEEQQDK